MTSALLLLLALARADAALIKEEGGPPPAVATAASGLSRKGALFGRCAALIEGECDLFPMMCAASPKPSPVVDGSPGEFTGKDGPGNPVKLRAFSSVTSTADGFRFNLSEFQVLEGNVVGPGAKWEPSAYFCRFAGDKTKPVLLRVVVRVGPGTAPVDRYVVEAFYDPSAKPHPWSTAPGKLDAAALEAAHQVAYCDAPGAGDEKRVAAWFYGQVARVDGARAKASGKACSHLMGPLSDCEDRFRALGDATTAEALNHKELEIGCLTAPRYPPKAAKGAMK